MKVLSFSIKKFYVRFGLVSDYDIGGMILSPYALNLIDDSIAPILLGVTILEAAIMGSISNELYANSDINCFRNITWYGNGITFDSISYFSLEISYCVH